LVASDIAGSEPGSVKINVDVHVNDGISVPLVSGVTVISIFIESSA